MKLFKAQITQFNIEDEEIIKKNYSLMSYASNKKDKDIILNHLRHHIEYYKEHKEFQVSNLSENFVSDGDIVTSRVVDIKSVPNIKNKLYRLSNIANVEEVFSDWTSKLIGWQIVLENGNKMLFQVDKEDILTDSKKPFIIEDGSIIQQLLNSNLVYLNI